MANIERCIPYLEQTTQTKIFKTPTWQRFSWQTYTWQDNNTKTKFYVKIIARLKPRDGNQDILFVAKYPVKLNIKELPANLPLNLSYAISSSPEKLPEDTVVPDGTTYSQNTTPEYWRKNVGNVEIFEENQTAYFKALPKGKLLDPERHYNMASIEKIYTNKDLPELKKTKQRKLQ